MDDRAASSISVCNKDEQEMALHAMMLGKVPLAHAALTMFGFCLQKPFLDNLYEEHRGLCYQDVLSFPCLVQVLSDALLQFRGSGRAALDHAQRSGTLEGKPRAFYDKLKRAPLSLSVALVRETCPSMVGLLPSGEDPLPACFAAFEVGVLDGKKLKNVAKRLLECRGQPGKLYGAMAIAWYDPRRRLVCGLGVNRDGEANENSLVEGILKDAHRRDVGVKRLWLCDALYCDLVQMTLYRAYGDSFVVRQHPKLSFTADPQRPAREFYDAESKRWLKEEWGWAGAANDPRRTYVRRVHWLRGKTQAGQQPLIVVTNLLDGERYPSAAILELYLQRWCIETVFQEITEVFSLRKLVGCTPEAVTFQLSLSIVMYNILQVLRGHLAQVGPAQPLAVNDVSTVMVFRELKKQLTVLAMMGTAEQWTALIEVPLTLAQMTEQLRTLLTGVWRPLWKKARNPKKRSYGPKAKGKSGSHTSVHRLQEKAKKINLAKPKLKPQ